ncbi:MAG: gluconate permease, partial [Planctomycetes bacterium]|nr:gluconate permease [Planctomycetota bacterium]
MLDPLVILLIGIVTVVGMIIVLRVNAFIALITAAMVVSLLSAGELGEKISRVAEAFGTSAGKIGIVIAMAAVIGKCLMDSGAADRIVRSFLKVLGEKNASVALMGSGFALSMPVFFDTVFYLLVPLARSLWRRTRHNYVLYVTAIGCGAAITHTLVPPTPGPLLMAENLSIDLGMMIMMGILVGLPTAAVGLAACHMMNRLFDIPMRPYSGEVEPEPLADDDLPPLWLSLLPIVLPLAMISTNTVAKTIADAEHKVLMREADVFDWPALAGTLADVEGNEDAAPAARAVWQRLPQEVQESILAAGPGAGSEAELGQRLQTSVRALVDEEGLRKEPAFAGVSLPNAAERLRDRGWEKLSTQEKQRFNWMLLESVFTGQIKSTPRRSVAAVTSLLGDPNLALLLSAAIAMFILVHQRHLPLRELAKTAETALMSGGVIILITAGGGAFGAMLGVSGIKEAIQGGINLEGGNVGMIILLVGFGVAAVMKVAQGSSTVSMIITSAMIAAMRLSPDVLGFHPVYLALAIGNGSLVGSWMNDSGFWIFARMSGLTEVETLKSWTILLLVLGVAGMGFTLLFS